jgi:hypothetical protein
MGHPQISASTLRGNLVDASLAGITTTELLLGKANSIPLNV